MRASSSAVKSSRSNAPTQSATWDARDAPIRTSTVPSVGVGNTEGGQDVVWPDWAAIGRLGEGIRTGTLGEAVAP